MGDLIRIPYCEEDFWRFFSDVFYSHKFKKFELTDDMKSDILSDYKPLSDNYKFKHFDLSNLKNVLSKLHVNKQTLILSEINSLLNEFTDTIDSLLGDVLIEITTKVLLSYKLDAIKRCID